MSGATFTTRPSRQAAKQQRRILLLVDAQAGSAPFEDVPLAGDQVFDCLDALPQVPSTDLDVAEMEPELARARIRQRHRDRHRVGAVARLLDEADDALVVDLREAQLAGLQQSRIAPPDSIKAADIVLDIARLVPVADLEHPRLAGLQMEGQDVGRVDEEIGPEIFAFRITRELAQIGLQLLLAGAPR